MQNRFNNNDFEHFVKQNADQYRMFPSDKVWKGIHNTLHTRRRWYGIGLALLLLTTGVVTWMMLIPSAKNRQVADKLPEVSLQRPITTEKIQPAKIAVTPARPAKDRTSSFTVSTDNLPENIFAAGNNDNSNELNTTLASAPGEVVDGAMVSNELTEAPQPITRVEEKQYVESSTRNNPASRSIAANKTSSNRPHVSPAAASNYSFVPVKAVAENKAATTPVADKEENTLKKESIFPYTIESVVNSYTRISKRKRVSLQFYVTPTISYRELKQNKPYIDYARNANNGGSTAYYSVDINKVVTHKPDLGLQLGFSAGYPLSKKLRVIGGLQFNVSKYDIRAYDGPDEMATITLSPSAGGTRTVSTLSSYRNTGSSAKASWLHNLYFSASAPIGLELKLLGRRKSHMGVAATIQPTYIISNRSYLISTDYKNYAEVPSLTRKWNVNTGFEVFAGYTTGSVSWRIGPQVRYQAMSSFESRYPVKEHLFDFGLKLGLMLNK
jgi:hypothetical protein